MEPWVVTIIIFGLVLACMISYYFLIPASIDSAKQTKNNVLHNDDIGYWGEITGDFNWCEYNYKYSYYIAEPMNTFSSLLYSLGVFIDYKYYKIILPHYLLYLMFIIFIMGIGSTLFHATLKYEMQVLDEIPMYLLAGFASVIFYARNETHLNTSISYKIGTYYQFIASLLMFIVFLFTPKSNIFHIIGRFYLNTFLIWFVYVFIAANNTSNDLDKILKNDLVSTYFAKSFIYFIIALVCWLLDNFICYNLHNLPFGIPYFHLHSMGWHLGTILGLHHIFMVMIAQYNVVTLDNKYKLKNSCFAFGLLSYLEIKSSSE